MERKDVARTKKLIEDAYFELMFKKENKKITVNDIINEAGVSRSTFYAHYQDINALDECVENRIVEYIRSAIVKTTLQDLAVDPREPVTTILDAIIGRGDILRAMINQGWKPLVMKRIRGAFDQAMGSELLLSADSGKLEAVNTCIKGVLLEACYYSSMNDTPADRDVLIDTVCDFISGGIEKIYRKS